MQRKKSDIRHWLSVVFAAMLLLSGTVSCGHPLEAQDQHTAKRTLIIYMMANNSLYTTSFDNIMSMLQTADLDCLNDSRLLIVFKKYSGGPRLLEVIPKDGFHKANVFKDYYVEYGLKADTVCLKAYDNIHNALETSAMRQILRDARTFAPAEDYALLLWSHSTGWLPGDKTRAGDSAVPEHDTRYFGLDGGNCMEITELKKALQDFDWEYILMDACFGCSIEALYDLRDVCRYWVGSPCEVLDDGFPYKTILPFLFEKSTLDGLTKTCRSFIDFYRNNTDYPSGFISLIDMSQVESLAVTVRDIVAQGNGNPVNTSDIQYYDNCRPALFNDLAGYVNQIATNSLQYGIFTEQLNRTILFSEHTKHIYSMFSGRRSWIDIYLPACGLTTYIPNLYNSTYNNAYRQTEWAKFTGLDKL